MPRVAEFCYNYADLVKLSGLTLNTIHQHTRRGTLDPANLESVLIWLARHGDLKLRQKLVYAALSRELDRTPKPRCRRK